MGSARKDVLPPVPSRMGHLCHSYAPVHGYAMRIDVRMWAWHGMGMDAITLASGWTCDGQGGGVGA